MLKFIYSLFFVLCLTACGSNDAANQETNNPPSTPEQTVPGPAGDALYPSITMEEMQNMWNNTTSIDYLFYELPISMNMVERPAIESTLRQISDKPARIDPSCKAMGRVFFQNKGEAVAEADFYFTPKCTYFIFMENQKPVKSNQMTAEGVKFFQNIINSSTQQK